ncbi:hypothetical protein QAD02_007425 [Eretmocerus hayati]|uniref:Uncharacterized protein n=1 Tax=Eretmocerus hayati TaxID=131215 RepID=A0ACC2N4V6_9HYME|nr:hypothetical protein QAD02_007425 [Eretmocerus hayati]
MNLVAEGYSANPCQDVKELFQAMFPGCIPELFSMSPRKASHLTTDALGPYFRQELLLDLQSSNSRLVIQLDEFSNAKQRKELRIRISYWSNSQNRVVNRHLVTYSLHIKR